jgi:rhodanese-related sulfurtransferase
MSKIVDRSEVRWMLAEQGAQLVEVLPGEEFESEHIRGAISLPLKDLNPESAKRLDRERPIVVYCDDFQ